MLAIEFILVAAIFILGTTIVWSQLHPMIKGLKCDECKCNCPTGPPGPPGQSGLNCELISKNGKLGCKYATGEEKMSNIAMTEAAGFGIVETATSYSAQLWLLFIIVAGGMAILFYENTVRQKKLELADIKGKYIPQFEAIQTQLKTIRGG